MGTLYSIQGMHKIAPRANPSSRGACGRRSHLRRSVDRDAKAFNVIFSVFIQEMLHLQLAANIAGAIGVDPDFTSPACKMRITLDMLRPRFDGHSSHRRSYGHGRPYNAAKVNIAA